LQWADSREAQTREAHLSQNVALAADAVQSPTMSYLARSSDRLVVQCGRFTSHVIDSVAAIAQFPLLLRKLVGRCRDLLPAATPGPTNQTDLPANLALFECGEILIPFLFWLPSDATVILRGYEDSGMRQVCFLPTERRAQSQRKLTKRSRISPSSPPTATHRTPAGSPSGTLPQSAGAPHQPDHYNLPHALLPGHLARVPWHPPVDGDEKTDPRSSPGASSQKTTILFRAHQPALWARLLPKISVLTTKRLNRQTNAAILRDHR